MKDAFGQELKVGDRIVYGVKNSTDISMRKAVIKSFSTRDEYHGKIDVAHIEAEIVDYDGLSYKRSTTVSVPRNIVKI